MKFSFSAVVFALALAVRVSAAERKRKPKPVVTESGIITTKRHFKPVVTTLIGHHTIGRGVTVAGVNADILIEAEVSDELVVGVELDHRSTNPVKSVFAR